MTTQHLDDQRSPNPLQTREQHILQLINRRLNDPEESFRGRFEAAMKEKGRGMTTLQGLIRRAGLVQTVLFTVRKYRETEREKTDLNIQTQEPLVQALEIIATLLHADWGDGDFTRNETGEAGDLRGEDASTPPLFVPVNAPKQVPVNPTKRSKGAQATPGQVPKRSDRGKTVHRNGHGNDTTIYFINPEALASLDLITYERLQLEALEVAELVARYADARQSLKALTKLGTAAAGTAAAGTGAAGAEANGTGAAGQVAAVGGTMAGETMRDEDEGGVA